MLTIHDMGHEPTERNGQDDEHGKVQDVLNRSLHSLRITPHQNVDVIDKESNADDSDDGTEDVHLPPLSRTVRCLGRLLSQASGDSKRF